MFIKKKQAKWNETTARRLGRFRVNCIFIFIRFATASFTPSFHCCTRFDSLFRFCVDTQKRKQIVNNGTANSHCVMFWTKNSPKSCVFPHKMWAFAIESTVFVDSTASVDVVGIIVFIIAVAIVPYGPVLKRFHTSLRSLRRPKTIKTSDTKWKKLLPNLNLLYCWTNFGKTKKPLMSPIVNSEMWTE